jgi:AAA domain
VTKDRAFSMLVHAAAKVGKSTLSATAPHPMLVLDAEGGWRFIRTAGWRGQPLRKYPGGWNPLAAPPPRYDGTWDVCVVTVTSWQTMEKTLQSLTQQPHDFATVVLDSITEVQRRCKANISTTGMQIQDWGTLLTKMDACIRGFRDLTLLENSIECVVFIAESRVDNGKMKPYMQGQIGVSLPYWVDICGYLNAQLEDDPNDPNGASQRVVRKLRIGSHPQVEAGERVQGALPDTLDDPHITQMMNAIFGVPPEPEEAKK